MFRPLQGHHQAFLFYRVIKTQRTQRFNQNQIKTHTHYVQNLFFEIHDVYEIMWKNIV